MRYDRGMAANETRTRSLNWFVRGGVLHLPDGARVPIDVESLVVGRDPGAAVPLADAEVSALHCELRAVTEGIVLRDLGSTNGTFIGKVRVREVVLGERTEIDVGQTRLVVEPSGKRRVDLGFSASFGELVGSSPRMRRLYGVLEKVAPTPLSLLILGETGTGKELVARAVHDASPRKGGPFVVVDCGSIPATLAESLLFGHEKGAFTGATERRKGRSPRRAAARCSSTSSGSSPSSCSRSSSARSRSARSSAWGPRRSSPSTYASSRRPEGTSAPR